MKKELTNISKGCYTESLKTSYYGFRTRQICDFFVFAYWRMRAENTQYQPKHLVTAFSESATSQICVAFLRKVTKMTNTIISKLLETRNLLDIVYSSTESDNMALRCSVVRRELASIIAEMLVKEEVYYDETLAAE